MEEQLITIGSRDWPLKAFRVWEILFDLLTGRLMPSQPVLELQSCKWGDYSGHGGIVTLSICSCHGSAVKLYTALCVSSPVSKGLFLVCFSVLVVHGSREKKSSCPLLSPYQPVLQSKGTRVLLLSNPGQRRLESCKRDRTFKLINRVATTPY